MKRRDAARVGRASETMIDRLRQALARLEAKEKTMISAVQVLEQLNAQFESEFVQWADLVEQLDADQEIVQATGDPPAIDIATIITSVEEAFAQAREGLEGEIESYESVVQSALDYEEEDDGDGD